MLAVSLLLLVGVVAGYAAVSSPELRGPYATPRPLPSVVNAPRFTPMPVGSIEPASIGGGPYYPGCVVPGAVWASTVFVNGHSVIVTTVASTNNPCVIQWGQPPSPMAFDRVSR